MLKENVRQFFYIVCTVSISKDKNVHHKITNTEVLRKTTNYGTNQKPLNQFIFNDLIN